MADSKILDKISKLLALSESSNPNEASIALERAQKLMQEHSVSLSDISLSSIVEQKESMPTIIRDSSLYSLLSSIITRSFGVRSIVTSNKRIVKSITFIGPKERVETSCYVFTVIARQLAIAKKTFLAKYRQETLKSLNDEFFGQDLEDMRAKSLTELYRYIPKYIKSRTESKIRKSTKAYIHGWLLAVHEKVNEFVIEDNEILLIEQYFNEYHPKLGKTRSRTTYYNNEQMKHFNTGERDGKNGLVLLRGVNGEMNRKELGYK